MILIDYKSRKPIYEQIIDSIKSLIVSGVLERDDQFFHFNHGFNPPFSCS